MAPNGILPSVPETKDVIIIGAGWYGLAAAKTYLSIHPSTTLTILDNAPSVGGVWSRSRIYPRLVLNQPTPHFEYSDLSMSEVFGGVEDYSDITGEMVATYLETYAGKFNLTERCRFNTQVVRIEREEDLGPWKVTIRATDSSSEEVEVLRCAKLILSTGHECVPNFPEGLDRSKFTGPVFHAIELGKRHDEIINDENIKSVTVMGGNKSAFEIAANLGLAGKKVNWLIREDGMGPGMLMLDRPDGKKHGMKGVTARAVSSLAPTLYTPQRWITRFLYGGKNWFGRWFSVWFWKMAWKSELKKYGRKNVEKIAPMSDSLFWISAGLAQYHANNDDEAVFKLIENGEAIKITRASIATMENHTLTLSTGEAFTTDAVIFATGWKHPYALLFDPSLAPDLGIPIPKESQPLIHRKRWEDLDSQAEREVVANYPLLASPPENLNLHLKPYRQYSRHFRFTAPPAYAARNDNSIVFLGNLHAQVSATFAEISSLWAIAYLEGMFPTSSAVSKVLGDKEEMEREAAYLGAYFKKRYVDLISVPLVAWEMRECCDRLLEDLGVRGDRHAMRSKGFGWWGWRVWLKEYFTPYAPGDYKGIIEEFLEVSDKNGVAK